MLLSIALPALAASTATVWLLPPGGADGLDPAPFEAAAEAPGLEPVGSSAATRERRAAARRAHAGAARGRGASWGARRRPAPPVRIAIPAAGAKGPVDRIGARDGRLVIPPAGRAGWFKGGPRPGEVGRAVIVSHVDSREGPALFAGLLTIRRGSPVGIRDRRGRLHHFRVVRRRQVEKSHFSAASIYGASRRRVLVLITCGGPFIPGSGYRDNVILYARAS